MRIVLCAALSALSGLALMAGGVDFSVPVGRVRPLNGLCNLAPLANTRVANVNDQVAALKIPYYRQHDAVLENPGLRLVDVSRIFPLFHADADDPRNYDFRATDDYLSAAVREGAELEFRLGESIEHSPRQYAVNPPPDFGKWADICVHIIRHYNEGWANGHRWNIRRWSIWEEPNTVPTLLNAPNAYRGVYFPLYATVVRRLKAEFPGLQVCGPQTNNGYAPVDEFVEYCASNSLPLDVLCFSSYDRNPEKVAELIRQKRKLLDERGFSATKISIGEWHWGPLSWHAHGGARTPGAERAWIADLTGVDAAVYAAALMIRMQDEPVDYMHYYSMKSRVWGLFGDDLLPMKTYWAFKAFAETAACPERVRSSSDGQPGVHVLAVRDSASATFRVLVAALRTDTSISIRLAGCGRPREVRILDTAKDLEPTTAWAFSNGAIHLQRNFSSSALWLITCEKEKR